MRLLSKPHVRSVRPNRSQVPLLGLSKAHLPLPGLTTFRRPPRVHRTPETQQRAAPSQGDGKRAGLTQDRELTLNQHGSTGFPRAPPGPRRRDAVCVRVCGCCPPPQALPCRRPRVRWGCGGGLGAARHLPRPDPHTGERRARRDATGPAPRPPPIAPGPSPPPTGAAPVFSCCS